MAMAPKLGPASTWNDLVEASLLLRLCDFIDLRQDTRQLQQLLRDRRSPSSPMAFSYTARARSIRHRDYGMALLSAVGAFLAIVVMCAIWISTGWPEGSAAPMMAAVACCFFATFDDPAPYIIGFANSAIIGALCAAVYLFGVLPKATTFEMLVLALAPWLITCGLLMAQPRMAPIGTGIAETSRPLPTLPLPLSSACGPPPSSFGWCDRSVPSGARIASAASTGIASLFPPPMAAPTTGWSWRR
jgi:uncharacterized membrane protein YccC